MYIVGAIEIVAGLAVLVRPRFGGFLVASWLGAIIVNLLMMADFYDIALRDFGLLLGALTLTRLATAFRQATGRDTAEAGRRWWSWVPPSPAPKPLTAEREGLTSPRVAVIPCRSPCDGSLKPT
jgi:hypothetical protein